jgi:hypothetical protein
MRKLPLRHVIVALSCAAPLLLISSPGLSAEAKRLYEQHCASCHAANRLGGMGPALLPENLRRLRPDVAAEVIADGRIATQMPGFSHELDAEQISLLVDFIYEPLAEMPVWGMAEMDASRVVHHERSELSDTPLFDADPLNLFIVVELGDHHASLLDGDSLEVLTRFPTRYALHGGPKYEPDGRFVYFASRDGWISKFDIYNMKTVAEIRAGINTRNVAVSGDGRYLLVGNYLPHSAVLLDAGDLTPLKIMEARDSGGNLVAGERRLHGRPARELRRRAQGCGRGVGDRLWDTGVSPAAHRTGRLPGRLLLRSRLPAPDRRGAQCQQRPGGQPGRGAQGGRTGSDGITAPGFRDQLGVPGRPVLATPNLREGQVSVIDMEEWKIIERIDTLGPGFFMRSHGDSPYAWVDVFFGPDRDAVHIIDKNTLEIVRTLRPAPGKTAAHVEYDRHGRYAILSIWDDDGAIVIYDGDTLEEVKRIPMKRPSGKYNVYNKTRLDPGTSH